MSAKGIESWKADIAKGKQIFVANNVKAIDPIFNRIVKNLLKIELIQYVRVGKEDIQASNEIMARGRTKIPRLLKRKNNKLPRTSKKQLL